MKKGEKPRAPKFYLQLHALYFPEPGGPCMVVCRCVKLGRVGPGGLGGGPAGGPYQARAVVGRPTGAPGAGPTGGTDQP